MTRAKISEYSATAGDNTDVNGTNIAEGCPPSGINDAIREVMGALKRFETGSDGDSLTVGGQLTVTGTTTTSPAIVASGDTNTGIFFPAADTIAFAEGGAEAMRIDSSGNVGIGTSSPVNKLSVSGDVGASNVYVSNGADANAIVGNGSRAYANFYQVGASSGGYVSFHTTPSTVGNLAERMRITSAGEVLVGGTTGISSGSGIITLQRSGTPVVNLFRNDTTVTSGESLGSISYYGNDTTSNTPTQLAYINAVASGTHAAGDNPTDLVFGVTADNTETVFEALRIRQDGSLVSQDTYDNTQSGSTVVVTSGGVIGRTSSSIKYKKDVETLDAELVDNAITNLRPVWYRTKDAKGDDKETWSHIGLIAEEVHEVEPRLVRYRTEKVEFVDVDEQVTKTREVSPAVTDEDGNVVQEAVTEEYTETVTRKEKHNSPLDTPEPEDVDYGRLAVLCLAKIQQQEQTIAALEARIAALENGE